MRRGTNTPGYAPIPALPTITKRVLPNGLTVLFQERRSAPVVATMMWYRVGTRDELPGSTGLAHFLEHLLFKGTPRYGKGMVDRLTYRYGGRNNAFTSNDFTAYTFEFPKSAWKQALALEADRMRNCLLDPREFESERKVVMEERRMGEDDPPSQLYEQVNSLSFIAHPYRYPVIGWMADLRRVTRGEVARFYGERYVPGNAVLVIVGDLGAVEAIGAARAAFATIPRLPAPPRRQVTEPEQAGQRRVELSLPANLPRVDMAFHVPRRGHADLYALEVLQYALAEGRTSRLYRRLVDQEQLTSEPSSSLLEGRDPAHFYFSFELKAGVDPARVERIAWEEFRAAGERPLDDAALERARNAIESRFIHERTTAEGAASQIGLAEAIGSHRHLLTYLEKIRQVSGADVQRVARQYLQPHLATVGHLVPKVQATGDGALFGSSPPAPLQPPLRGVLYPSGHSGWRGGTEIGDRVPWSHAVPHPSALQPAHSDRLLTPGWLVGERPRVASPPAGPLQPDFRAWREARGHRAGEGGPRSTRRPMASRHRSQSPLSSLKARPGTECPVWAAGEGPGVRTGTRAQRTAPPRPTFPPLDVLVRTLPNGLRLLLVENHDLPSITLTAQVKVGSRDDTDETAGLAQFVASMLDEGTRSYDQRRISETLEGVGAEFAAAAGRNTTSATLRTVSRHLAAVLPVYAEMLSAPTFPVDRAQLIREQLLIALQAADEDPSDVARRAFFESVFAGHPHHRPVSGYQATVRRLGPDQLREFHRRAYTPGRTTIAAVGDFSREALLGELTRLFGGWQSQPTDRPSPAPPGRPPTVVTVRKTLDKAQTQIVLGHVGVGRLDPDYPALLVLDSILGEGVGGGFTARIPYQLRDVQGLAYAVGSSITSTATLDPGVFAATIGTEPANEQKAVAALLREIRRIRDAPVTAAELNEARNYLVNSYVFDFETNAQQAGYLLETAYYNLGFDYRNRLPGQIRAVTAAEVQRVARKHLDPIRYTLVVVGPNRGP